jgi:hypothetical protein
VVVGGGPVKHLEDLLAAFVFDADAVVFYAQAYVLGVAFDADDDVLLSFIGMLKLERIREQIVQDGFEAYSV